MSDPTGGTVAAFEGDAKLFEDIGAELPDEPTAPPEVEAAVPATPEVAETPAEEAQRLRDEQGRFAAAPKADAAPAPVAAPQAATTPAPTAPTSPDAPALDLSQYPTYEYRGPNGQMTPFKGAIRGAEGTLFTKDALPVLERKLAEAESAHQRLSQMGRTLQEKDQLIKAANDEKNLVLERLAAIMNDEDAFADWAADTRGNWEKLQLQARLQMAERDRDARIHQANEQTSEQEVQALIPRLHGATEQAIQQLVAYPEFQDLQLDAGWQADFKQRMMASHFDKLFTSATAADVASGVASQVGETLFHAEPLLAEMRYQAGFARKELARQKGLAEAAQRNARTVPQTAVAPTPGARPQGTPSGKAVPALKPGMSKQEVDKMVFETLMD